ncbi:MAG: hypothetical protein HY554_11840 [Elusimicrobia bacterium]|nr:hypothetical protein [Elusimicrobiota bacterium]
MRPGPDPYSRVPGRIAATAVGLLLILAAAFWKDRVGWAPAHAKVPELAPDAYDTATVRAVRKEMAFDGAPCKSCHDGTEPMQGHPKEKGVFHEGIQLKHGRNQHCFNCHHRVQPADFANFDGASIALAEVQLLCSRCHGTTYRDWQDGAHGRRTGSWDTKGGSKATVCIACHDPHWPVFKPLEAKPAPGVNPRPPKTAAASRQGEPAGGHP